MRLMHQRSGRRRWLQALTIIRSRILNGPYAAGDYIDDAKLADELGFSRTPIREALLLLEADGLVEIKRRRGVRVVPITIRDMKEIIEILTALEVQAVSLIAKIVPSRNDLSALIQACESMKQAEVLKDKGGWSEADEQFHRALLICAGNTHMTNLGLRYRDRVRRAHRFVMRFASDEWLRNSRLCHELTITKLLSDKPEEAVTLHLDQRHSYG